MSPNGRAAKATARATLKGKWPEAIGVCAIAALPLIIWLMAIQLVSSVFVLHAQAISFFTLAVSAADIMCFSPLYLGLLRWFWQITSGVDEPVTTLFYYYRSKSAIFRSALIRLSMLWRVVLAAVICLTPYGIFKAAVGSLPDTLVQGSGNAHALSLVTAVIAALGILVLLLYLSRLYLAIPLLFCDGGLSIQNAFRLSSTISKGFRLSFFAMLVPGFLGWALLSLTAVPLIYTLPLLLASIMAFARHSITIFTLKNDK